MVAPHCANTDISQLFLRIGLVMIAPLEGQHRVSMDDEITDHDMDTTMMGSAPLANTASDATRASLLVLAGSEIGREYPLNQGEMILGRSLSADIRLDTPMISRKHAVITRHGEPGEVPTLEITDLQSSNGTLVNGAQVDSATLQNGDRIQLGDVVLKYSIEDPVESHFHRHIHHRLNHDDLTGLMTMEAFRRRLELALQVGPWPLVVVMTDLDGLKKVNDTHGHLAGRMVIREMGEMIRQTLRPADYGALYGGDECVFLLPGTTEAQARDLLESLRLKIETTVFEHHGRNFGVTISQGLCEATGPGDQVQDLIAAADSALYIAKADGRNCIRSAADTQI